MAGYALEWWRCWWFRFSFLTPRGLLATIWSTLTISCYWSDTLLAERSSAAPPSIGEDGTVWSPAFAPSCAFCAMTIGIMGPSLLEPCENAAVFPETWLSRLL